MFSKINVAQPSVSARPSVLPPQQEDEEYVPDEHDLDTFEDQQSFILKGPLKPPLEGKTKSHPNRKSMGVPFGEPSDKKQSLMNTIKSTFSMVGKISATNGRKSKSSVGARQGVLGYSSACRKSVVAEKGKPLEWKHNLNKFPKDKAFERLIDATEEAFEMNIHPSLIAQGTSGSYFIYDKDRKMIGVFKPADEEPYGHANPKWGKWVQRTCCPCCFGRGCLINNHGYLSEAGASLVDSKLRLGVVPKTRCVMLASKSFNNDRKHVRQAKKLVKKYGLTADNKQIIYPPKLGSYQTFVNKYKEAGYWLKQFEKKPPPPETAHKLKLLFDRLVILDYLTRNTDRGLPNWLIRYDPDDPSKIFLAAIDNGLAFPFKHPDQWRGYPFSWTNVPQANVPFAQETKDLFLGVLNDMDFVESLRDDMHELFSIDKNFKEKVFEQQMEVMRGQIQNLCDAMVQDRTPAQLAGSARMVVKRTHSIEHPYHVHIKRYAYESSKHKKKPCFTRC